MTNHSWLVVCILSAILVASILSNAANVSRKTASSTAGQQQYRVEGRDLNRKFPPFTGSTIGSSEPKNVSSSTMYFHQLFSKESTGSKERKFGQPHASVHKKSLTQRVASPSTITTTNTLNSHPTSIQAVNKTVNGANLTSSETQQYFGYEPTGWQFLSSGLLSFSSS